ncbi:hypothetical protein FHP25_33985 [Vineibacter terrae]|uniref:Apea-like HEPN domain-containing protein n=1 Tax=Vineibacter terrae TaxID=2586908 RepID=A0A5C8PAH0_9HYPH|nr:hypothetical protein [Vineibacter terrae]TXL70547.1 hypothetical protein FHP25_33985 [Vineibacter terrae]
MPKTPYTFNSRVNITELKELVVQMLEVMGRGPDGRGIAPIRADFFFQDRLAFVNDGIDIPGSLTSKEKRHLIFKAFCDAKGEGASSYEGFSRTLGSVIQARLGLPQSRFYLTTSVSLDRSKLQANLRFSHAGVRMQISRAYPRRLKPFNRPSRRGDEEPASSIPPLGYSHLTATVQAQTLASAADHIFPALDLWMGILNHAFPDGRIAWVYPPQPVNRLRLGKWHIFYDDAGNPREDHPWYDPEYQRVNNLQEFPAAESPFWKRYRRAVGFIRRRSDLGTLMISYFRNMYDAGSLRDPHLRLLRHWGVLETLLALPDKNTTTDKIVERASFTSAQPQYRKKRLKIIGEVRNRFVHRAIRDDDPLNFDEDLRDYLRGLAGYFISGKHGCRTHAELLKLLDMSWDRKALREHARHTKIAMLMRAGGDPKPKKGE